MKIAIPDAMACIGKLVAEFIANVRDRTFKPSPECNPFRHACDLVFVASARQRPSAVNRSEKSRGLSEARGTPQARSLAQAEPIGFDPGR